MKKMEYREVKSSERLPNFKKNRRKFVIYRYGDGSTELGLERPDAEEPMQYWLEEIRERIHDDLVQCPKESRWCLKCDQLIQECTCYGGPQQF